MKMLLRSIMLSENDIDTEIETHRLRYSNEECQPRININFNVSIINHFSEVFIEAARCLLHNN